MLSPFPKKIILFGLVAIFVFIFSAAKKEGDKNKDIYSEMERMEKQVKELEEEKRNLSDLMAFLDTPDFVEKEAKKQLSLQNPGEKVIVIIKKEDSTAEPAKAFEPKKESNISKWINFIFNGAN